MADFFRIENGIPVKQDPRARINEEPKVVLDPSLQAESHALGRAEEREQYARDIESQAHVRLQQLPAEIAEADHLARSYAEFENYRALAKFNAQDADNTRIWQGGYEPNREDWQTALRGIAEHRAKLARTQGALGRMTQALAESAGSKDPIGQALTLLAQRQAVLEQDYALRHQRLIELYGRVAEAHAAGITSGPLHDNYAMKYAEDLEQAEEIAQLAQARATLLERRNDRSSLFEG